MMVELKLGREKVFGMGHNTGNESKEEVRNSFKKK